MDKVNHAKHLEQGLADTNCTILLLPDQNLSFITFPSLRPSQAHLLVPSIPSEPCSDILSPKLFPSSPLSDDDSLLSLRTSPTSKFLHHYQRHPLFPVGSCPVVTHRSLQDSSLHPEPSSRNPSLILYARFCSRAWSKSPPHVRFHRWVQRGSARLLTVKFLLVPL